VFFDSKLSFQRHVNETVRTCNFRLKNMSRIGSKLDEDLKKIVAQSYIMNKIDYCNIIYSSLNQNSLNKLQTVQNAAARFVGGVPNNVIDWRHGGSMHELLFALHFLPVKYRVKYKICLLCFKCLNNKAPQYLNELVTLRKPSRYNLRLNNDKHLLAVPQSPRYKKTENAFYYIGPQTWNDLPYSIRIIDDMTKFKVALKTHFFQIAFSNLT